MLGNVFVLTFVFSFKVTEQYRKIEMARFVVNLLSIATVLTVLYLVLCKPDFSQYFNIDGAFMESFRSSAMRNEAADTDTDKTSNLNVSNEIVDRTQVQSNNANNEKSLDEKYCQIDCKLGVPCTYRDEVDLRIMVMAFNRPESLAKCLRKIEALDTIGERLSVEVWIDRLKSGLVDNATVKVAEVAKEGWRNGRMCVHIQRENANIGGQWRNTWRPKPNTKEIGLILEDDVDISPHTYRYLKAVTEKYGDRDDVSGYSLQMHDIMFFGVERRPMRGPASANMFLYGVLGTWGFAPRPKAWRDFQDWFQSKNDSLRPIVPGISPTRWYQKFERQHKEDTMWEMWHIYFSNISNTYCVYCNLVVHTGRKDVLLSVNRKEPGLHFRGAASSKNDPYLLLNWNETYIRFPENITKYNYDGIQIS